MNLTDVGSGTTASSWGWADEDGRSPCDPDDIVFQKWSVRTRGIEGRVGFLLLPPETDGGVVLGTACAMARRIQETPA